MDEAWAGFSTCFHDLDDEAMGRELGPAFGPFATSNRADLLLHVADLMIHHGAEITLLRDLYGATHGAALWRHLPARAITADLFATSRDMFRRRVR